MIGTSEVKPTNVPIALAVALLVAPAGILVDQMLVRFLGRPYFSLPRLEFFLFVWPFIAMGTAFFLKRGGKVSIAKGLFWHGAILITASGGYMALYYFSSIRNR